MKMRVGVLALGAGVLTLCLMATPTLAQTPPTTKAETKPSTQTPAAEVDLSGTWQGTVAFNPPLRGILHVSKAPGGGYAAIGYSIDEGPQPLTVDAITLNDSTVKYTISSLNSSYEGQLSSDGQTIKGKWGPPGRQATLDLVRATKETEWAINQAPALVDDAARAGIVAKAADALRNRYIFPDVGETAATRIEAQLAAGAYSKLDQARPLADKLTADLYAVAKDKHLRILAPGGAGPAGGPAPPPPPRSEAGVVRADRLAGNIGYIEVIGFPPPETFKAAIDEAMASIADTKALVVDDRRNGGGSPDGVAYLVSFFLDSAKPTKINDFINRTPGAKAFTTRAEMSVTTPTSYRGKPVYVLTSARTFSGGEEFAYDMQTFKLGTLVGETTGGGANPGGTLPVGTGLAIFLPGGRPVNAVTGTNWEGVGVIPDINTPVDDALKVALEKLGQKPASGDIDSLSVAKLFTPRSVPQPGTEAIAREAIVSLARGDPDYSRMGPQLANATRQQLPGIQKMLTDLGELQSVTFREVGPNGMDAYDIKFANGSLIYMLALDDQGKVVSALISRGGAAAVQPAQPAPANRAEALAMVDKAYADEAAAHPIGGLTVGVVDHGKLIWTKSYGFADMEAHAPATRRTVYRIGSITKQFTAIALLQLAQQGKVSLDDLAVKYLPELKTVRNFGDAAGSVTLLSLATHRAGLTREPDDLRFLTGPIDGWEATAREALAHTTEAFKPNEEANYSNIGYSALGLALETASGLPYIDLVERNVIKPLGMTSTGFRPDATMRTRLAKGYGVARGVADSSASQAELVSGRGYKIPNGGLFTTVDDLAKFLAFEMGYGPRKVLPPATLAANFQRSYPMRGGGRYGVGFQVIPLAGGILVGHGGSVAGYEADAVFDPASQIGIVCLRNSDYPCEGPFLLASMAALGVRH